MFKNPDRQKLKKLAYGVALAVCIAVCLILIERHERDSQRNKQPVPVPNRTAVPQIQNSRVAGDDGAPTLLYSHNLVLRKGPNFRVYIRWIRGNLLRTHEQTIPSFDDPDSFVLSIQKGVVDIKIADLSTYMSSVSPKGAQLKNITIEAAGDHLRLKGVVHKGVPIPVTLEGTIAPTANGRVRFHPNKISALKLPIKSLLGALHLQISDLLPSPGIPGLEVVDNDVLFDTQVLLPPPHIRGDITSISTDATTIKVIYGGAHDNEDKLARWHNFLQLTGGTLSFGKVTMHQADLTMIDASREPWFDLDLVNYQAQLVDGYTRMTAQAGLEVFMPGLDENHPGRFKQSVTLDWLKNRETPMPKDVPSK